ncbi:MAG TPA: Sb-PDE family phosphodiesterase [Planctomycetota bacterium]|jgi:hypothetical protein|nr:histidinol-phosphatase [Planctomycetota bacterium]OQC19757.1 MAG: hypothetical protein BWX69_02424 [Planctomycetes bacterium ADurb.Bin069]HNR97729.1 Sb-PDE family phosphodiesterase [Planctomycetota bacterium]HNU24804.1 Sb-PDE family phosphodiesterase [Planctomycetota bacterium]HOE30898.1 Sb-PDE family phosphodiesterase [Planctomycetota bacterium]
MRKPLPPSPAAPRALSAPSVRGCFAAPGLAALLFVFLLDAACAAATLERARTPVRLPDIPGFLTLACDFHTHTVFSDAAVWPATRVEEAWREGLDAIAITDHIEYQPHKKDLPTNHNRPYEIAKGLGGTLGILVLRGAEITRGMPPGHINAIFLEDCAKLETKEWRDAVKAAHAQGAFIFWNHPCWIAQQPDGVGRWYDEHTELLAAGMLHGIEVFNHRTYCPEAHRWAVEKNLTHLANSDTHAPILLEYDVHAGDRRPTTLVFAKERTEEGLREALFARRTAAWAEGRIFGSAELLRPVFARSIEIKNPRIQIVRKGRAWVQIHNASEVRYELEAAEPAGAEESSAGLSVPKAASLPAGKTVLFPISGVSDEAAGSRSYRLPYRVKNLLTAPNEGLRVTIDLEVTFAR